MAVANILFVEIKTFNESKRADRVLDKEMVVVNGAVGIVVDAEFVDGSDEGGLTANDHGKVKVSIRFTHKTNGTSPIAQVITQEMIVNRNYEFTVLNVIAG